MFLKICKIRSKKTLKNNTVSKKGLKTLSKKRLKTLNKKDVKH